MKGQKRFIPVSAYMQETGLSYPTVVNAIRTGQIRAITTESGHYKVDTLADQNADLLELTGKLENLEGLLKSLCVHLGLLGGDTD